VPGDAHALEAQGVAVPFMVEAELLAEFLGDVLGALARLLQRGVMGAATRISLMAVTA
jgi:hypothetical protein